MTATTTSELTSFKQQALQNIQNLRRPESDLTVQSDVKVGDLVFTYSRGAVRKAVVIEVRKTNATVLYTTEGAVNEARKIYDIYHAPGRRELTARRAAKMARENHSFYVQEANPTTAKYSSHRSSEEFAQFSVIATTPVEQYVADEVAKAVASHDKSASYSVEDRIHYTTKVVKLSAVYEVTA